MPKLILETSRLKLREMTWDDLDFIAAMLADPLVMRHYPNTFTRDESRAWLQKVLDRYRDHGYALWLVETRGKVQPIGQVGLMQQHIDGVDEAEIGYLIHSLFWRQGYAVEAAAGVRDHAFSSLNKDRVISLILPANIPSQRVALRLGMKPEKVSKFRNSDSLVYSLARDSHPPKA